jgi:hypothetical protein
VADAEVISIAIALLALLGSVLFTNWQIGGLKTVFREELSSVGAVRAELMNETTSLRAIIECNQTVLLARINTINEHLTRLEERIH